MWRHLYFKQVTPSLGHFCQISIFFVTLFNLNGSQHCNKINFLLIWRLFILLHTSRCLAISYNFFMPLSLQFKSSFFLAQFFFRPPRHHHYHCVIFIVCTFSCVAFFTLLRRSLKEKQGMGIFRYLKNNWEFFHKIYFNNIEI